jgi:hypothetical protein
MTGNKHKNLAKGIMKETMEEGKKAWKEEKKEGKMEKKKRRSCGPYSNGEAICSVTRCVYFLFDLREQPAGCLCQSATMAKATGRPTLVPLLLKVRKPDVYARGTNTAINRSVLWFRVNCHFNVYMVELLQLRSFISLSLDLFQETDGQLICEDSQIDVT